MMILKFLFSGSGKISPDWIVLDIKGDFLIAGTRQAFPLSLNAYVDPHFFRNSALNFIENYFNLNIFKLKNNEGITP